MSFLPDWFNLMCIGGAVLFFFVLFVLMRWNKNRVIAETIRYENRSLGIAGESEEIEEKKVEGEHTIVNGVFTRDGKFATRIREWLR